MRGFIKLIVINFLLIAAILMVFELVARVAYDNRFLMDGNQYVFFEFDDYLGWHGIPNTSGPFERGDEFKTRVTLNGHGMRDKEYSEKKQDGIYRIAVLGDSFTWGFGVENREIYTEVLEAKLGPKYEVLNFGTSGYGRGQQWLQLKRDVLRFDPDAILIMAYPGNDLEDNLASSPQNAVYPRPYFSVDKDSKLETHGLPVKKPAGDFSERLFMRHTGKWMGFYIHSYLVRVLYHAFHAVKKSYELAPGAYLNPLFDPEKRKELTEGAKIEKAALREMKNIADEKNLDLYYVIASMTEQVRPQLQQEIAKQFPEKKIDWMQPTRLLLQAAQDVGIETLSLTPVIAQYEQNGTPLHNEKDFHWNVEGNRIVGETIAGWIEEKRAATPQHEQTADPQPE